MAAAVSTAFFSSSGQALANVATAAQGFPPPIPLAVNPYSCAGQSPGRPLRPLKGAGNPRCGMKTSRKRSHKLASRKYHATMLFVVGYCTFPEDRRSRSNFPRTEHGGATSPLPCRFPPWSTREPCPTFMLSVAAFSCWCNLCCPLQMGIHVLRSRGGKPRHRRDGEQQHACHEPENHPHPGARSVGARILSRREPVCKSHLFVDRLEMNLTDAWGHPGIPSRSLNR